MRTDQDWSKHTFGFKNGVHGPMFPVQQTIVVVYVNECAHVKRNSVYSLNRRCRSARGTRKNYQGLIELCTCAECSPHKDTCA